MLLTLLRTNRILLSLIGMGLCIYLVLSMKVSDSLACPLGGSGCDAVNKSPFSKIAGIHVSQIGLLGYSYLVVLCLVTIIHIKAWLEKLILISVLTACLFTVYLLTISMFIIQELCFWCVISAVNIFAMALLQVAMMKRVQVH
ncbi:hypothetical protein FZC79_18685 [Rossellomorea vietnamensis]|uniref:Vitamin K epoxide reductase domain-containing protein n=1 Tax=Rossellomorea vietnamensis TaxID=218284 RepID=A0A5D4K9C5_9BACI|nr:vitamin K epoxide reductase family protein [Rossellomorea vietnamensis]TYR73469.1 hypothetical protein FZC79_18685 [Rossellomorea vietnamensis]